MTYKNIFFSFLLLSFSLSSQAQVYFTRAGKISFYSNAPMENIEAHNVAATSIFNAQTGQIEFAVLIKAFQFEKALMQEHFNGNYLESSKFPKSTFKGEIVNLSDINFNIDGIYNAVIKGILSIHGVSQNIQAEGKFMIRNGQITATSRFNLAISDYNIKVPNVVRDNIAKVVRVSVDLAFEKMEKGYKK